MVPPADPVAGLEARPAPVLDPLAQALEGPGPAGGAPIGDLGGHREALAHRRTPVVGHAQGPDQLVVELVVAEALHPDGAADDVGVFEGHDAHLVSGRSGRTVGPAAGRWSLCPMRGLPCDMRVAAVQTTAGPDRQANLEAAEALVDEAVAAGAGLVVLPEYFSVAGTPSFLRRHAEPLDGPTLAWGSAVARRHGIHLVAGSFPERPGGHRGGRRPPVQHQLPPRPRRVGRRRLPQDPPVRRGPRRHLLLRVRHHGPGDRADRGPAAAPRRRAPAGGGGALGLLRPPVPRALPDHDPRGGHRAGGGGGLHRRHRARPLGAPAPGAGGGERGLRGRQRPGRGAPAGHAGLPRPHHGRGPLGHGGGRTDRAEPGDRGGRSGDGPGGEGPIRAAGPGTSPPRGVPLAG